MNRETAEGYSSETIIKNWSGDETNDGRNITIMNGKYIYWQYVTKYHNDIYASLSDEKNATHLSVQINDSDKMLIEYKR